jgi:hypothetical protein
MQQIASLDPTGAAFNIKYFPDSNNELAWDKFETRFKLSYIQLLACQNWVRENRATLACNISKEDPNSAKAIALSLNLIQASRNGKDNKLSSQQVPSLPGSTVSLSISDVL